MIFMTDDFGWLGLSPKKPRLASNKSHNDHRHGEAVITSRMSEIFVLKVPIKMRFFNCCTAEKKASPVDGLVKAGEAVIKDFFRARVKSFATRSR
jgi:hypothetical protein